MLGSTQVSSYFYYKCFHSTSPVWGAFVVVVWVFCLFCALPVILKVQAFGILTSQYMKKIVYVTNKTPDLPDKRDSEDLLKITNMRSNHGI